MEFLTLSLPEAAYLYMGLAIQGILRTSSLRWLPAAIITLWAVHLLVKWARRRASAAELVGYLLASAAVLALFWPEATLFGRDRGRQVTPDQVASYAAEQDDSATVVTAEDTGQVPQSLGGGTLVSPGMYLLLRPITELPLAIARAINSQAHRPFETVMPMHWLLGTTLTADVTTAVSDWVHNCYLPALTTVQANQQGRTKEDLNPWEGGAIRQALGARLVTPGAQTGIAWIAPSGSGVQVRCDIYLEAVELRTQGWLFDLKSPKGVAMSEVWSETLGLEPQQQARFILYREMARVAGPEIPAPSLTAQYAGLRAGSMVGGAISGLLGGGSTLLGQTAGALAGEFGRVMDAVAWVVGMAVFLTWWGPYVLGLAQMIFLALFPFVVLWALQPGQQLQPLVLYFVTLLFLNTTPLWWALIDQGQKLATAQAPGAGIWGVEVITAQTWSMMITALGILLTPVAVSALLFLSFRAVGSLWRGTTI